MKIIKIYRNGFDYLNFQQLYFEFLLKWSWFPALKKKTVFNVVTLVELIHYFNK